MAKFQIQRGSSLPAFSAVTYPSGCMFFVTATSYLYISNGTDWALVGSGGGGSVLTPDELDAINWANSPSISNVFSTDSSVAAAVSAEASTRAAAVSAEASARSAADVALQGQIDSFVAPSDQMQDFLSLFLAKRSSTQVPVASVAAPFNNLGDPLMLKIGPKLYVYYSKFETTGNGHVCRRIIRGNLGDPSSYGAEEIMLAPAGGTAWDKDFVRLGNIVKDGTTYYMYYVGLNNSVGAYKIGLATSIDGGTTWTRYNGGSSPIVDAHGTYTNVEDPAVLKEGANWYMYYSYRTASATLPGKIVATSVDGVTWTDVGQVLTAGAAYDLTYIEHHQILKYGDLYLLIYDGYNGADWSINIAYSETPTGVFTKFAGNPVFTKSGIAGTFDEYHVATQFTFNLNGQWYMFYQGGDTAAYISSTWKLSIVRLDQFEMMAGSTAPPAVTTKLLLHMNGADGSGSFMDETGKVVTNYGAIISNATPNLGGACGSFLTSSSNYLSIPDSADFNFGSGDFTIDFRVSSTLANDGGVISKRESGTGVGWIIEIRATGAVWLRAKVGGVYSDTFLATAAGAVVANTVTHVAVVRNGSSWYIFVNGVQAATTSNAGILDNYASPVIIGSSRIAGGIEDNLPGILDEVRVSNIARWTAAFTPPTVEYTVD